MCCDEQVSKAQNPQKLDPSKSKDAKGNICIIDLFLAFHYWLIALSFIFFFFLLFFSSIILAMDPKLNFPYLLITILNYHPLEFL